MKANYNKAKIIEEILSHIKMPGYYDFLIKLSLRDLDCLKHHILNNTKTN